MSLVKVSDLLKHATENKYGVPAINVFNYESIAWAIKAAERENMPIIIQFYPGFDVHMPMHIVAMIAKDLAAKATVPVAVHLDHSASYEIAVSGLGAGFPSVMVDGSALPFEENVKLTAEVAKAAHVMGVDVEAELGHVGSGMSEDDLTNTDHFTDPKQAVEFVERTGCESLAIAIGNGHGHYVKTPELDFDRIKELRRVLDVALVMHGGSDIPVEQLQEAVRCGMSKFNIATEYQRAFTNSLEAFQKENTRRDYIYGALRSMEEPCIAFVQEKIRILNPNNYKLK